MKNVLIYLFTTGKCRLCEGLSFETSQKHIWKTSISICCDNFYVCLITQLQQEDSHKLIFKVQGGRYVRFVRAWKKKTAYDVMKYIYCYICQSKIVINQVVFFAFITIFNILICGTTSVLSPFLETL